MVLRIRTNGEREGTLSKAVLLHMNVNTCPMSQDEFLQYTELLEKAHCTEKDDMLLLSQKMAMVTPAHFLLSVWFWEVRHPTPKK